MTVQKTRPPHDHPGSTPSARVLAELYSETGNPLYAWFSINESLGGRFGALPPAAADYLHYVADRIGEIERDDTLTPSEKTRKIADALGFIGTGRSNPFTRFRKDREDVRAHNAEGMHRFLQCVKWGKSTRELALTDTKVARSTAISRLRNSERIAEIWERYFPRRNS